MMPGIRDAQHQKRIIYHHYNKLSNDQINAIVNGTNISTVTQERKGSQEFVRRILSKIQWKYNKTS